MPICGHNIMRCLLIDGVLDSLDTCEVSMNGTCSRLRFFAMATCLGACAASLLVRAVHLHAAVTEKLSIDL